MFSKLELKLFDVAYDALRVRVPTFDRLGKTGYYDAAAGIEKFVEIEFIDGVIQSGLSYSKKGVGERDCDVIVEGIGVELRCIYEKGVKGHLLKAFKDHKNADLYLFLSGAGPKEEIEKGIKEGGFAEKHKQLSSRWMIWLVKREVKE